LSTPWIDLSVLYTHVPSSEENNFSDLLPRINSVMDDLLLTTKRGPAIQKNRAEQFFPDAAPAVKF